MFKKFRSISKEDIDQFLNKQNSNLHKRKIQISFYLKKKKKKIRFASKEDANQFLY